MMSSYVLGFRETDRTMLMLVGGKGANLGELSRINGIRVPPGFCVTTEAYKKVTAGNPELNGLLDQLACLKAEERENIGRICAKIREVIGAVPILQDIAAEITGYLAGFGEKAAFAVRSSATAEDLPSASFAGQQDSYLNITGKEAIFKHISKCWASLYTDRAVIYRMQNDFDQRKVHLAVIIQQMVSAEASGVLFTADPVTCNRKVMSIDAGFGLGEVLVSGLVNVDSYKVRDGKIESGEQNKQVLTAGQVLRLGQIGRTIEAHFGAPQDIEWCMGGNAFYIVQSRPITTLFPIPDVMDQVKHVYVSVGHQQMMTDPIRPLGIAVWQLTAARPMFEAGGRLFVDIAPDLASPGRREMVVGALGKSDPLLKDALGTLLERGDFGPPAVRVTGFQTTPPAAPQAAPRPAPQAQTEIDPAIVDELIRIHQTSIETLKEGIQAKSGPELVDFILEDIRQLRKILADPRNMSAIMAGMNASWWVNDKMAEWLGEKNAADVLSQSVPDNITSEMGLALLDLADTIRPYPEMISYLNRVKEDDFLDQLVKFDGGLKVRGAIEAYLDKYGMRCVGEIDITKTRWSEKPSILVPLILSNIKNFGPDAGKRKFEEGRQEALRKERELLDRLRALPDGEQKARETKQMISQMRNFLGYREYPKYGIVNRYFIYKQSLLKEAGRLVRTGIMQETSDIYYLRFDEVREVLRTNKLDQEIVGRRKAAYKLYEQLTPPRLMTSDGEIIAGRYKREQLPAGAMPGLAVSSGVIEGRARVILRMEDAADLDAEDILITCFTDPSWTPLFVSIKGLVTEVGGLMTHGAVIAREYGLPAVVGVENATSLIKDGQRIRVNGTEGYVEIL